MTLPDLRLNGYEPTVVYSLENGESMTDAVLAAFERSDVDIDEFEITLYEQIDDNGLEGLFSRTDKNLRLTTRLWNRPVVITPEQVTIYDAS
jgi:hypothetical protein